VRAFLRLAVKLTPILTVALTLPLAARNRH
jgi:hypothetical protein